MQFKSLRQRTEGDLEVPADQNIFWSQYSPLTMKLKNFTDIYYGYARYCKMRHLALLFSLQGHPKGFHYITTLLGK